MTTDELPLRLSEEAWEALTEQAEAHKWTLSQSVEAIIRRHLLGETDEDVMAHVEAMGKAVTK